MAVKIHVIFKAESFLEKHHNGVFCLWLWLWWKKSCQQTLVAARMSRRLKALATIKQTNWFFQWTPPDGISFTVSQGKTACHLMLKKGSLLLTRTSPGSSETYDEPHPVLFTPRQFPLFGSIFEVTAAWVNNEFD